MEKLITKITDNDFGLKFGDMEKPQLRKGARGIVIREDGKKVGILCGHDGSPSL